jgi:hypothetical protein
MKSLNRSQWTLFFIALIFFFWTLLLNIDRRIDENFDIKETLLSEQSIYEQDVKVSQEITNLINSYGNNTNLEDYSSSYVKLLDEKVRLEKKLLESGEKSLLLAEQRLKRLSIIYLIYPEYQHKDKLYFDQVKLNNDFHSTEINSLNETINSGAFLYTEEQKNREIVMVNDESYKSAMYQQGNTAFLEYYWKYNMYKPLIYQWYWGTFISVISAVSALSFLIWSLIEFIKTRQSKQPKYVNILLLFSALIFFYSFMFFGPLMFLPKIPYISW